MFIIRLLMLAIGLSAYTAQAQTNIKTAGLNGSEPPVGYKTPLPDTSRLIPTVERGYAISVSYPDSGIKIINTAFKQSINARYYDGMFECALALGVIEADKGEFEKAKSMYQQALFYSSKTNRIFLSISRVLNNVGNVLMIQGNYSQSAKYFYNAIFVVEKDTSRAATIQLARIYSNLGGVFVRQNQPAWALQYLNKAELMRNRAESFDGLSHIYNNKGTIYKKLGDLKRAKEYYTKALEVASKYHNEQSKIIASYGLTEILIMEGQSEKAIPILKEALATKRNINPYSRETGPLYLLGTAYLFLKDYTTAEKYLLMALDKSNKLGVHDHALRSHLYLSKLYEETRNYKKAFEHQKAYLGLHDSALNREKAEAINELEIKYRTAEKDKKLHEDHLLIKKQTDKINRRNRWVLFFSFSSTLLFILFFVLFRNYQHKRRLHEAKIQYLEQQQEINTLKAIMQGEEKERIRIAQELHDGIGGTLAAVKMNFTAVQNDYSFLGDVSSYQDAVDMLDKMSNELRQAAHNLMPEMLVQYGLPEAVRLYCEQIKKGKDLVFEFQSYGAFSDLDNDFTLSIYRIIQELIHNIVKHSQATHAIVQLSRHEHLLSVVVEDNGVGFTEDNKGKGIGLINLQARVKNLNGSLSMESSADSGTSLYLEFDLQTSGKIAVS